MTAKKIQELSDFARFYGFHYDLCDAETLIRAYIIDMERGLAGSTSSLPMIPTHITTRRRNLAGKTVIALDAGGTNLRAACVHFDESGIARVVSEHKTAMPGTYGQLGEKRFFDDLAAACVPVFKAVDGTVDGMGFCFSFSLAMQSDGDGTALAFGKEVDEPEVIGKPLGRCLKEALARRCIKAPEKIHLLNDTVATLLTGCAVANNAAVNGGKTDFVGFILGTGMNIAYPEKNIPKTGFANNDEPQIVVCESGTFAIPYQGAIDKEFDRLTKNAGTFWTEKMVSGAFLGPLNLLVLKKAVKEGLVKFNKSEELLAMDELATKDLNTFLCNPLHDTGVIGSLFGGGENDARAGVLFLGSIITERAALISGSVLAAVMRHIDAGGDPLNPAFIAVEGTTFQKYHFMRQSLEAHLRVLLNARQPCSYILQSVEQASLLGAAVAAV
ncbi:hexokinase [Spirochaetia bacterium]|nr:hexokinase [Spirochaetia bacterium]